MNSRKVLLIFAVLAGMVLATTQPAEAQVGYTVTDLSTLGGKTSAAYAINNRGQVVGTADTNHQYIYYTQWMGHKVKNSIIIHDAFLWTPSVPNGTSGTLQDLNPSGPSSYSTVALAVNSSGLAVGEGGLLWQNGVQIPLGSNVTAANGINDSGEIVGAGVTGSYDYFAFLLTGGVSYQIGVSSISSVYVFANAINSSGQVVGCDANGAFLWTPATPNGASGILTNLGALLTGNHNGSAFGLNDPTLSHPVQVVGGADPYIAGGTYAFLWDSVQGMRDLGALPGDSDSIAYGINNVSQVVGISVNSTGERAFLWDSVNGMRDLNSLISAKSGWTLQTAYGINNHGQIVGVGINVKGDTHAFLLTPQ